MSQLVRRTSDGKLFRPLYPSHWTKADAVTMLCISSHFYFRSVEWRPWWRWGRWVDTSELWETHKPEEFYLVNHRQARDAEEK